MRCLKYNPKRKTHAHNIEFITPLGAKAHSWQYTRPKVRRNY